MPKSFLRLPSLLIIRCLCGSGEPAFCLFLHYTSQFVRVTLVQEPCYSSLYLSNLKGIQCEFVLFAQALSVRVQDRCVPPLVLERKGAVQMQTFLEARGSRQTRCSSSETRTRATVSSVMRLTRQGAVGEVCHVLDLSGLPDTRQNRKKTHRQLSPRPSGFPPNFSCAHQANKIHYKFEKRAILHCVKRPALRETCFCFRVCVWSRLALRGVKCSMLMALHVFSWSPVSWAPFQMQLAPPPHPDPQYFLLRTVPIRCRAQRSSELCKVVHHSQQQLEHRERYRS